VKDVTPEEIRALVSPPTDEELLERKNEELLAAIAAEKAENADTEPTGKLRVLCPDGKERSFTQYDLLDDHPMIRAGWVGIRSSRVTGRAMRTTVGGTWHFSAAGKYANIFDGSA